MAEKQKEPKRLNRTVGIGEAMGGILDPMFKKRGFASRDIVTHWTTIAPEPYDKVTLPDKLSWPRGDKGGDGATLYLRCAPGHALALAHEGQRIAAAVNRYFGFILVNQVRQSLEPFSPHSAEKAEAEPRIDKAAARKVDDALAGIEDEDLRAALRQLGTGIMRNKPQ